MSISCIHQVALAYSGGGANKVYVVQVTDNGAGEFCTTAYYGRRGSTLTPKEYYRGASVAAARADADKQERAKRRHSSTPYWDEPVTAGVPVIGMPSTAPVFGGASSPGAPAAAAGVSGVTAGIKPIVGILPMLPSVADADRCEVLLSDPGYAAQRKYDGERITLSLRRSGIKAANLKGEARPLTAGAEAVLKKLLAKPDFGNDRETVVDGEIMGDVVVLFDLMTLRDNDVRDLAGAERYFALEELLTGQDALLAPTAWDEAEKRAMLARARAENWEGIMFRQMTAHYVSGRTEAVAKFKLWDSATCRVLTVNAKRSVQIGLLDDTGVEVFAGNVTVPANMEIPAEASLVEVRYLYAHDGGSLYQPTLLGVRDDKDVADLRSSLRPAPPEKSGGTAVAEALAA